MYMGESQAPFKNTTETKTEKGLEKQLMPAQMNLQAVLWHATFIVLQDAVEPLKRKAISPKAYQQSLRTAGDSPQLGSLANMVWMVFTGYPV